MKVLHTTAQLVHRIGIRIPLLAAALTCVVSMSAQTYYVSTTGNDTNNGKTLATAFASLAKAQSVLRLANCSTTRTTGATVNIEPGTYYLLYSQTSPGTLAFTCLDSGISGKQVTWRVDPANTGGVAISGAIQVGGTAGKNGLGLQWQLKTGTGTGATNPPVYYVALPATYTNTNANVTFNLQPFEYLYYQPASSIASRRLRSRIEQSSGVGFYMDTTMLPPKCTDTQGGSATLADCNLGTYLRVKNTVAYNGTNCPNVGKAHNNDGTKCLDRFVYSTSGPDQIMQWKNLNGTYSGSPNGTGFNGPCNPTSGSQYPEGDVGLTLIDSWTVDAMRIACIDPNTDASNPVIYLTAATKGNANNPNNFGPVPKHRYYIENANDAFWAAQSYGQTGLWYWDRSTSVLYYIANSGENPNTDAVLIPQLPYSSGVSSGQQLSNLFPQMSGGADSSDFVGGSLLWAQAPTAGQTGLSYVVFSGLTFEMDDFVPQFTGFNNDTNGEMSVPQTIDCESCQNVTFTNDTVAYTSGSGILVASPPGNTSAASAATGDKIANSSFFDIGDSGIRVGHAVSPNDTDATFVVNGLTINNNLIDGYSRVFADGEGIAEGNGQGITITHNDITDGYHAGISICQVGCGPFDSIGVGINGSNIKSSYNKLWQIMQSVTSDGGSLYYNVGSVGTSTMDPGGTGTSNSITNNVVYDTVDSSVIDSGVAGSGYGGEGIYLDIGTGATTVSGNVVFQVNSFTVHLTQAPSIFWAARPNTFENNIFSLGLKGMIVENTPWTNGCASNFKIDNFYWNIFNFDQTETQTQASFFVVAGCDNPCGQDYYKFLDFEANAYWNTKTNFCADTNAFHVLDVANSSTLNGSCTVEKGNTWAGQQKWLSFDTSQGALAANTWMKGHTNNAPTYNILEDDAQDATSNIGTCSWLPAHKATGNTGFGTNGVPGDYTLVAGPNSNFNFNGTDGTNETISNAGSSAASIPTVPRTLPTYTVTSW